MGRKKVKTYILIFLIIFTGVILFFFARYCYDTSKYNKKEHVVRMDEKTDGARITMVSKKGGTNFWTRKLSDGMTLTGGIYEIVMSNYSPYEIADWRAKVTFRDSCFLNGAWDGTVEVHQFRDGEETEQELDLKSVDAGQIKLEYRIEDSVIFISIQPGDYLIYHPAQNNGEMKIAGMERFPVESRAGLLLYYEQTPDLTDVEGVYHFNKKLSQGREFTLFIIVVVIWIVFFAVYLFLTFYHKAIEGQLALQDLMLTESLMVFSNFVDAKDSYTSGHSKRVALYSQLIAEEMGMDDNECKNVYFIALMHDCGKCKIPDEILNKPSKLTKEEFEVIKSHTIEGARMLEGFDFIEGFSQGALCHHEKYDGSGYPNGLKGEEIPLIGRIICVADSYDAMASRRIYRDALSLEMIKEEFVKNSGKQFDPEIVEVFLKLFDKEIFNKVQLIS